MRFFPRTEEEEGGALRGVKGTADSTLGDVTPLSLKTILRSMTSLSYGRVFCLESQKIDGTEYLRGSTDFAIFFILLNLEA